MKKLLSLMLLTVSIVVIMTGCCCTWDGMCGGKCCSSEKSSESKCAMCAEKCDADECLCSGCGGKVCYDCAKKCTVCPKCKMLCVPGKMKDCKGKCACGCMYKSMKNMSEKEMDKMRATQKEMMSKCMMCKKKLAKDKACVRTPCGMVGCCCAKKCMMCPECKMAFTPEQVKCMKGKCCGKKVVPMKNMTEKEMSKMQKDQVKCMEMCKEKCK